jgi:hypothetical protein
MKALTSLVSLAAVAASMSAVSLPAQAAVFAQFSPLTNASDFRWVKSGGSGPTAGTGGHFFTITSNTSTVAQSVAIAFAFLDPAFAALGNLKANLKVDATAAAGNPASFNATAGTYTQAGLNGGFSVLYSGVNTTIAGHHLVPGENLLSGTFTDAWIQGSGGTGSTNVTMGNGGTATYSSALENFSNVIPSSEEFAFNLLGATPKFAALKGKALTTFRANGGGNFGAVGSVPEPATWGLMILGFGGIGAVLRRRRTSLAVA